MGWARRGRKRGMFSVPITVFYDAASEGGASNSKQSGSSGTVAVWSEAWQTGASVGPPGGSVYNSGELPKLWASQDEWGGGDECRHDLVGFFAGFW